MTLLKSLAATALISMSTASTAGMISDYSLNGNIVTDAASNLEWLQWSVTEGMSINAALDAYSASGWTLATSAQIANLFTSFDLSYGRVDWSADIMDDQYAKLDPLDPLYANDDRFRKFTGMFGGGFYEPSPHNLQCVQDLPGHCTRSISAFYSDIAVTDPQAHMAYVYSEWDTAYPLPREAGIWYDVPPSSAAGHTGVGVALVRTASVPEPSSLALFSLATMGLASLRRRKVRK